MDEEKRREYQEKIDQKLEEARERTKKPASRFESRVQEVQRVGAEILDASIQATDELLKELEKEEKKAFEDFQKKKFSEESEKKFLERIKDIIDKRGMITVQRDINFCTWTAAIPEKDLKKYLEIMEPRIAAVIEQAEEFNTLKNMKVKESLKYDKGSEEYKKCDAEIKALEFLDQMRQCEHMLSSARVLRTLRKGEHPWFDRKKVQGGDPYMIDNLLYGRPYADAKRKRGDYSAKSRQPEEKKAPRGVVREFFRNREKNKKERSNESVSVTKESENNDESTKSLNNTLNQYATRVENTPAQEDKTWRIIDRNKANDIC